MTVTAEQWRAYGQQFVDEGYEYCINCDRCGGSCHCLDCSGLQCRISNGLGLTRNLCTTSFVIAQMCWDAGLYLTEAQVRSDDGPDVFYAFHGADGGRTDDGSRPNGASGHIVTVVRVRDANGHTIGFYTIEAMGHAYGVVNGTFEGRGWTGFSRIPGVVSGPSPPPPFRQENTMIVQKYHYRHDGTAVAIPVRWPDNTWHVARVFVGADGKHLDLRGGASINGDQERTDTYRVWTPPTNDPNAPFDPKHDTIVAVALWSTGEPGSVPGIFVQYSNGHGRPVRFS